MEQEQRGGVCEQCGDPSSGHIGKGPTGWQVGFGGSGRQRARRLDRCVSYPPAPGWLNSPILRWIPILIQTRSYLN